MFKLSGAFYQAQRSICSSPVEHIPSSVEHIQVIKLSGAIFTTHGIKLGKT